MKPRPYRNTLLDVLAAQPGLTPELLDECLSIALKPKEHR